MAPVCQPRAIQGAGMCGRRDTVNMFEFFVCVSFIPLFENPCNCFVRENILAILGKPREKYCKQTVMFLPLRSVIKDCSA